jgi:hypothetical protein
MFAALASILAKRALLIAPFAMASTARAQVSAAPPRDSGVRASHDTISRRPAILGWQVTVIPQALARMHAAYSGGNSLTTRGDAAMSHTYGVYTGWAPADWVEGYLDVELFRGEGISRVVGLGGLTNGDVLRQGAGLDLGHGPYLARGFARFTLPLGGTRRAVEAAPQSAARRVADRRLELVIGRLALNDLVDLNRYANSTRTQFLNWGLWNNTAWDFAANTRGYSNGISAAWITREWSLRWATFQMPRQANGNVLDGDLAHARGDNLELTLSPRGPDGPTLRLLGYRNLGRMGRYADVVAAAASSRTTPDITSQDLIGSQRIGLGLNAEWPLTDDGATGAFARVGWSDGRTESFAFTEVDRHASVGMQISGAHWQRASDVLGVATVVHGLSADHRAYLAAGGSGFLLGDGALDYAPEWITEAYYRWQPLSWLQITPDVQGIVHPGYNAARGPTVVGTLRIRLFQ